MAACTLPYYVIKKIKNKSAPSCRSTINLKGFRDFFILIMTRSES